MNALLWCAALAAFIYELHLGISQWYDKRVDAELRRICEQAARP